MTAGGAVEEGTVSRGYACFLAVTAVLTYLLVTMGGVVCATGAGLGCPDWPGCYGRVIPPMERTALIEVTHRVLAAIVTPLVVAAALANWKRYRAVWWQSRPPLVALFLIMAVIVFGAFAVLTGLPPVIAALDVGSALTALALLVAAAVIARLRHDDPRLRDRLSLRSPLAARSAIALAGVFLILVTGVFAATPGSIVRCLGWPLAGAPSGAEVNVGVQLARGLVAIVTGVLVLALAIRAWREVPPHPWTRPAATGALGLFLAEAALGAFMLLHGFTLPLLAIYVALAAGLWAVLAGLTVLTAATAPLTKRS